MKNTQEPELLQINKVNNFDFLRLVFACFVIISHSYPIAGGGGFDWLYTSTNGQTTFSFIGVKGFFSISGYLIFQSLERSKSFIDYYWKRILRLFPALFVVLLLTVILAPIIYQSATPYLSNRTVWTYIPNNMWLYTMQFGITGVFESNPFPSAINGSLWTIPYEFTLYWILSVFILFRKYKQLKKIVLVCLFVFLVIGNIFFFEKLGHYYSFVASGDLIDLGVFFVAGSLLACMNIEASLYKNHILIAGIVLLVISFLTNQFVYTKYFLLPICTIFGGILSTPVLNKIGSKIGDLSYGIYIYSFPVQQTLVYYFKLSPLELMLPTLCTASVFAYFSWHVIEKKALRLKKFRLIDSFNSISL